MLLRSASAACHSFASKPSVASVFGIRALRLLFDLPRGMGLPFLYRFLYVVSICPVNRPKVAYSVARTRARESVLISDSGEVTP